MQEERLSVLDALVIKNRFSGSLPMSVGEQAMVRTADHAL